MKKIKVFIADDHTLFRQGIAGILSEEDQFIISGQAETLDQLLASPGPAGSNVLTLDISFGESSSFKVLSGILCQHPNLRVIMLSMHNKPLLIKRALNLGASGYFLKNSPAELLIEAIKTVASGHKYIDSALSDSICTLLSDNIDSENSGSLYNHLTNREQEIFRLLAEGETPVSISRQLNISRKTAENHRSSILQKLQLDSQVEIVQLAEKLGVI